jgi:vacuolar-type H+-ATPase subunit H
MDDQAPSGGSKPPPGAAAAGGSSSSADQRIQAIIQAAEQAAAGIIEDADAQARHYIDSSRQKADALADERVRVMSGLTETLVRQAELVRRQSDELLSALDSARTELAGQIGKELTTGAPSPAALAPQSATATEPRPESEPVSEAAPEQPAEPPEPEQPVSTPPPRAAPAIGGDKATRPAACGRSGARA